MTISYNWLHEYLPVSIEPARLSNILTSLGLEVEDTNYYESMKGGLKGLVIGEVIECIPHPNADKLKLTSVSIGNSNPLQIICGAPNVQAGQKVIVAPVGSTIYPKNREPLTMKVVKIRGIESYGMICAEDEIGLSEDHGGIMVLPADVKTGILAADYFHPYTDWVYEIGLTPNRMDAMSHLGVAKDVCAYLVHHEKKGYKVKMPSVDSFWPDNNDLPISVIIENISACQRYSGVSMAGITVKESPGWLQDKLRSIGQRPINNIVDITNYVLHESGQPLHAFDIDQIKGKKILVKNLAEGTSFITLDGKERKLSGDDLMICNGAGEGMCIAGVFGGINSGVKASTQNIFLESAWFNPVDIRKTSLRHDLRTDAATRFEKNVDISNTDNVLKRAAILIKEIAGGQIASEIVDVYPNPKDKQKIVLKLPYLKKLSGKEYDPDTIKKILTTIGFEITQSSGESIHVKVPYSKPDITLPADIVEEVMRIDGYDNIEIPSTISITPSIEPEMYKHAIKEKVSAYLIGQGFYEIFTNSITNSEYFEARELSTCVKLINNLSANHNIMRPSMMQTGLEAVAYNLNRKNNNLKFFEFGKTYHVKGIGNYEENNHLCLYVTGNKAEDSWQSKTKQADLYYLKGLVERVLQVIGANDRNWETTSKSNLNNSLRVKIKTEHVATLGDISRAELNRFDIKQPVLFADLDWEVLQKLVATATIQIDELPKQLPVYRDLALIVPKELKFESIENTIKGIGLQKLNDLRLFDIFESEKLGVDKKSLAINFTFLDKEKTLADKEIDSMMQKIISVLEEELKADIRK